jgi:glucose/arabinose dehydrogenase
MSNTTSFKLLSFAAILLFCTSGFVLTASAAAPAGFQIETITGGLNVPVAFDFAPDGRVFVGEKDGTVRVIKDGVLLEEPFIVLPDVNTYIDRGLIGLAVDRDFENHPYVYLSYTHENNPADVGGPKTARIVRVTADGDTALPGSTVILVGSVAGTPEAPSCDDYAVTDDCIRSNSGSHSAGGLRFGPDGYLYASLGDGAAYSFADPNALYSQDLDALSGKFLRITREGLGVEDNPFYTGTSTDNRSKVFAYGIRNSFRFNFRPSNDGLYAGEVGWFYFEEVNRVRPGDNFGWPCREGDREQGNYTAEFECELTDHTDAIYMYPHDTPVSITGGDFLGSAYPEEYQGHYVFGDYHKNYLARLVLSDTDEVLLDETWFEGTADGPVAIITGPDGYLYYLAIYTGELKRLVYVENSGPVAELSANPVTGFAPMEVAFFADGSFDPEGSELTYSYDFGDGWASLDDNEFVAHVYETDGVFTATLTVTDTEGLTDTDTKKIRVGGLTPPGNADPVIVSTEVSTTTPTVGFILNITTHVRNDGETDTIVANFEVYDVQTNELVHTQQSGNEVILADQTKEFTGTWTVPRIGDFRVAVSVLGEDGGGVYAIDENAVLLSVGNRTPMDLVAESLTATPSTVEAGNPITLEATVRNTGQMGTGLVDIEVWNEDNSMLVHQAFFDNEPFTTGQLRTFTDTWTPAATGTYWMELGTFTAGWDEFQHWVWHGVEITVTENTTGTSTGTTTPPTGPFELEIGTSTATPTVAAVGQPVQLETGIENTGIAGIGLVDIEIWNEDNTEEVFQEFFDSEAFAAGESRTFAVEWTPTATGTYWLEIGTFTEGWMDFQNWSWHAAQITVTEDTTGTSTGTTTPPTGPFELEITAGSVNPSEVEVGETVNLNAAITNVGEAGVGLVDIEVWNEDNTVGVFQTFFDDEAFAEGELRTFTAEWTPTATGTYWLELGTFTSGWQDFQNWGWHAAQITVTEATGTSTGTTTDPGDGDDDDDTGTTTEEVYPGTATLVAYSVVCDSEDVLPNWGVWHSAEVGGDDRMDLEDINAFVDAHSENCEFASGWDFEYGLSFPYPEDSVLGPSGLGTVFGSTDASGRAETIVPIQEAGHQVWMRVVPQEGHLAYTGKNDNLPESAEFYCASDLWHYDNNEIIPMHDGGTYYCLSMTAPTGTSTDPGSDDGESDIGTTTEPFLLAITGGTATPSSVEVGEVVELEVTVENTGGTGTGLVDIEVWNEDNSERIFQIDFDNEAFAAGESRTFTATWTPEELGTYWLEIGTFTAGWMDFQNWAWHADEITVTEATSSGDTGGEQTGTSTATTSASEPNVFAEMFAADAEVVVEDGMNDTGTFELLFDITAFNGDIFISTANNAVGYHIEDQNGATVSGENSGAILSTTASQAGDAYLIEAGTTESFTLDVLFGPETAGFYRLVMDSVEYGLSADTPTGQSHVVAPAEDFQTDVIFLNVLDEPSETSTSTDPVV